MPAPISFESQHRRESFHPGSFHMLSGSFGGAGFSFNSAIKASLPYMPQMDDHDMVDDLGAYHQPLEVDFCKDFSCCGLVLPDLHDLLQHYEEQHSRAEDDASSNFSSSPMSGSSFSAGANTASSSNTSAVRQRPDIEALKRKALADMHYRLGQPLTDAETASPSSSSAIDDTESMDGQYQIVDIQMNPRKRAFRPSMTSSQLPAEYLTPVHSPGSTPEASMPATPVMHLQHDFGSELDNPVLYAFPSMTDDWFMQGDNSTPQMKRMRPSLTSQPSSIASNTAVINAIDTMQSGGPLVIEHPGSSLVVVDKPFKCPVRGCDKAYKNQNGLKYHKAHGNCASDPAVIAAAQGGDAASAFAPHLENKPYSCNVCNKRYKNLNGLKYHAAHSHQNVTVDSIQNQMFHQSQTGSVW